MQRSVVVPSVLWTYLHRPGFGKVKSVIDGRVKDGSGSDPDGSLRSPVSYLCIPKLLEPFIYSGSREERVVNSGSESPRVVGPQSSDVNELERVRGASGSKGRGKERALVPTVLFLDDFVVWAGD